MQISNGVWVISFSDRHQCPSFQVHTRHGRVRESRRQQARDNLNKSRELEAAAASSPTASSLDSESDKTSSIDHARTYMDDLHTEEVQEENKEGSFFDSMDAQSRDNHDLDDEESDESDEEMDDDEMRDEEEAVDDEEETDTSDDSSSASNDESEDQGQTKEQRGPRSRDGGMLSSDEDEDEDGGIGGQALDGNQAEEDITMDDVNHHSSGDDVDTTSARLPGFPHQRQQLIEWIDFHGMETSLRLLEQPTTERTSPSDTTTQTNSQTELLTTAASVEEKMRSLVGNAAADSEASVLLQLFAVQSKQAGTISRQILELVHHILQAPKLEQSQLLRELLNTQHWRETFGMNFIDEE